MSRIDRSLRAALVLLSGLASAGTALAIEPAKPAAQSSEGFKLSDLSLERLLGLAPLRNVASVSDAEKTTSSISTSREPRPVRKAQRRAASDRTQLAAIGAQPSGTGEPASPVASEEHNTATGTTVAVGPLPSRSAGRPADNVRPEALPPVIRMSASTITYDAARGIQTTSLADGTTFVDLFDPQAFLRTPIPLR